MEHRDVEASPKKHPLDLPARLLLAAFISHLPEYCLFKQVLQALPLDSLHNASVFLSMVAFSVINIVLTLSSSYSLIDHRPACSGWRGCTIFHNDHIANDDCQYY